MSPYSDRNDHRDSSLPDLPGDPYGRDSDLYPPVPEFPRYDYWDESNFDPQQYETDMVVDERHSELPSATVTQQDRVTEPDARAHSNAPRTLNTDDGVEIQQPVRKRYQPSGQNPRPRRQRDSVTGTGLQAHTITGDMVTGVRPMRGQVRYRTNARARGGNPAWSWTPINFPGPRQMFDQALPALTMALSCIAAIVLVQRMAMLESFWALIVLVPSIALFMFADAQVHPMWKRTALMNLAAVGLFYPLLIVRQSYLRVPFVEWGNGTLTMPLFATLTIVVLLLGLAIAAGVLSQDDPEYAGVLFLPAALLVPFFAGATEIVSLRTALIIAAGVFLAASVLTVIASVLPGNFPTLVAPIALALEFFVLPLSDSSPIFPLGAGAASKLLFFVVLATTVGLTVAMPNIAAWIRQVRTLVRNSATSGSI